jgi:predicted phosphodiesterase
MIVSSARTAYLRKLLESGYSVDEIAQLEGIKADSVRRMVAVPREVRTIADIVPKSTGVQDMEAMLYDDDLVIPDGYDDRAVAPVLKAKRLGIICDLHIPVHDAKAIVIALKWLKAKDIDRLLILGDGVDSYGLTRHGRDGRDYTIAYEYRVTRDVLAVMRRFLGDGVLLDWVGGNHDQWLDRYIRAQAEKDARLDTLLQDEDGNQLITLPSKLKLHEFGITYHDNGMGVRFGELLCIHGHEVKGGAKYIAAQKLARVKTNVAFGHHHRSQEWYETTFDGSVRGSWAIGCLAQTNPRYNRYGDEMQGFAYVEFEDDGRFIFENKKIINGIVR